MDSQQRRTWIKILAIIGSLFGFVILTHLSDGPPNRFPTGDYVVKVQTIGSESLDNLVTASHALNRHDIEGAEAMVLDGRVLIVPQGTELYGGEVSDGIFEGYVQSGRLIDKRIYLGEKALVKK